MNTTGLVMTVTDELLAELELLASAATPGPWKAVDYGSYDGKMQQFYVDTSFKRADIFESGGDIEPNNNDSDRGAADMQFVACANPVTIAALTAELRRLRAENAELAKDAGRLDYMIGEQAIVYEQNGTASPTVYSLSWPVERCTQTEWHKSARDAIDTAMQAAQ